MRIEEILRMVIQTSNQEKESHKEPEIPSEEMVHHYCPCAGCAIEGPIVTPGATLYRD
jgi:hypothetical protein